MSEEYKDIILPIYSGLADIYRSSCDFVYNLPQSVKNVRELSIINGDIPYNSEKCLYANFIEVYNKNIILKDGKGVNAILRWYLQGMLPNNSISLHDTNEETLVTRNLAIDNLQRLSVQILDKMGNIFSFGQDLLLIDRIIPNATARIRTTVVHNLAIGDEIFITDVDNLSTSGLNKTINTKWNVLGIVNAFTFRISLDLSNEAINQTYPNYPPAYPFGQNAIVTDSTGFQHMVQTIAASGLLDTDVTLVQNHGLSIGSEIRINGMDNGLIDDDNRLMNSKHYIKSIPAPNRFVIGIHLSGYPANNTKTDTPTPFLLGSHGKVRVGKYQCTFDIRIKSTGKVKELSEKFTRPGSDSVYIAYDKNGTFK